MWTLLKVPPTSLGFWQTSTLLWLLSLFVPTDAFSPGSNKISLSCGTAHTLEWTSLLTMPTLETFALSSHPRVGHGRIWRCTSMFPCRTIGYVASLFSNIGRIIQVVHSLLSRLQWKLPFTGLIIQISSAATFAVTCSRRRIKSGRSPGTQEGTLLL